MSADLSREKRRSVEKLLRRTGILRDPDLSDDARVLYVVGALVANESGSIAEELVVAAMADPSIVQAAHAIIAKVGA